MGRLIILLIVAAICLKPVSSDCSAYQFFVLIEVTDTTFILGNIQSFTEKLFCGLSLNQDYSFTYM